MAFVPIDAIKELVTGSVWDKFKEMIEPYALINAIVFMVLNLALVYPAWGGLQKNPFVEAFAAVSDVWKLAAGTIILFVLSYLINHLSTFSLNFASGEVFRNSALIGPMLKARQEKVFDQLLAIAMSGDSPPEAPKKTDKRAEASAEQPREAKHAEEPSPEEPTRARDEAAFRLAYEFPVDRSELALSRLGNLLMSAPSYIYHQYGASMQLAWPVLQEHLSGDDNTSKAIQKNWDSLGFFANLYGLLILVAIEVILAVGWGMTSSEILQMLLLVASAALCYSASLEKARQWGKAMRRAFDSHLKDVFDDLGMLALKDLTPASKDLQPSWRNVMGWLAYGAHEEFKYKAQPTWYKPASSPPKLTYPGFLEVKLLAQELGSKTSIRRHNNRSASLTRPLRYLFGITNIGKGVVPPSGREAYLLVEDRTAILPPGLTGHLYKQRRGHSLAYFPFHVKGTRQAGDPDCLLFPLGDIPAGCSCILEYSVDSRIGTVAADVDLDKVSIRSSNRGCAADQFLDASLKKNGKSMRAKLQVQLLGDSPWEMNSIAELVPAAGEKPEKLPGVAESKSLYTWEFPVKTIRHRTIRIILGGQDDSK